VEAALLGAAAIAGLGALPRFTISTISQLDWVTEVQTNWPPIVLPGCLTIRFPWHEAADLEAVWASKAAKSRVDPDDEIVLTLHPGMAFGTGEHPTTQLCCSALRRLLAAESVHKDSTILDFGSGSGVLAFASLRFGAAKAVGVEIDPDALAVSLVNAKINRLDCRFTAVLPEDESPQQYSIVVANILAGTIIELSELLGSRVAPGGTLLLSGIWGTEQVEQVEQVFAGGDIGPFKVAYQDGWALLEASREGKSNHVQRRAQAASQPQDAPQAS